MGEAIEIGRPALLLGEFFLLALLSIEQYLQ